MKELTMASRPAITIPKTRKAKILAVAKRNLEKSGHEISNADILAAFNQVEAMTDIMIDEMLGSKNKYYIEFMRNFGDNKK